MRPSSCSRESGLTLMQLCCIRTASSCLCFANTLISMLCLNFAPVVVTLLLLPVLVSASAAGSCAEPVFIRIHDAPIAFDFAVPSGDAGGYYIDALKRSGLMVPVASCILADALRSLCRAKQPRGVFVDVGAHIGWFSAMAAAHGCDVVAIEPQERATACIHATVVANAAGWRNVSVSVVHAAAGRASGSATLSDSATSPDWALASVNFDSSNQSSSHPTRVVRIDDAVEEALGRGALSRVVAVKVDVEGAEVKLRARLPLFGVYILSFESFIHSFESFIHSLLQAEALEGAQLSIASASLFFLEVKRDGLTASVLTDKRHALSQMFPSNIWTTHEFFEEIGRKLPPPWGLEWHVLPVHQRQGWEGWPHDRHFDDHVMLRRDGSVSLFLPLEPRVVFEFPPPNFVYPIAGSSDSVKKGAGSLSGTVGIAVYSPGGQITFR